MFYNAREFSHHIHTTGETIMTQDELKKAVGWAALQYVQPGTIVGVGTGSTAAHFIDALGTIKDLCHEAMWLHKGRLQMRGGPAEVVSATRYVPAAAGDAPPVFQLPWKLRPRAAVASLRWTTAPEQVSITVSCQPWSLTTPAETVKVPPRG